MLCRSIIKTFFPLFARKAPQTNPPIPAPKMITSYLDCISDSFKEKSRVGTAIINYENFEMMMDEMLPVSEKVLIKTLFTFNSLLLLGTQSRSHSSSASW